MGIPRRLRRTRIEFFLMPATVCERGKLDASLSGYFKIPDASFWMDGRVRRGELCNEQQRPDAHQAEEDLEVLHASRVLPGFRHDKAARI